MKQLVGIIAVLLLFVVGALWGVPYLISLDRYQAQVTQNLSEALGRPVEIKGTIQARFLPLPYIRLHQVTVANVEGGHHSTIVDTPELKAHLALLPLLQGRLEIKALTIVRGAVDLEWLSDNRKNWEFSPKAADNASGLEQTSSIKALHFEDSRVTFTKKSSEMLFDFHHTTASLHLRRAGAIAVKGQMEGRYGLVKFSGYVGKLAKDHPADIRFTLQGEIISANFDGTLTETATGRHVAGKARVSSNQLYYLMAEYIVPKHEALAYLLVEDPMTLEGDFSISDKTILLDNAQLKGTGIAGSGQIRATIDNLPVVDIAMNLSAINLDKIREGAHKEIDTSPDVEMQFLQAKQRSKGLASFFPKNLNLLLYVTVEEVIFNAQPIKKSVINAELFNGELAIYPSTFLLPFNSHIEIGGLISHNDIRPVFNGRVTFTGTELTPVLNWLKVDTSLFPQLAHFYIDSRVVATPKQLRFMDMNAAIDNINMSGNMHINYGGSITKANSDIRVAGFNTNHYVFPPQVTRAAAEFSDNLFNEGRFNMDWLRKFNAELTLEMTLEKTTINQQYIDRVFGIVYVSPGSVKCERLSIASSLANLETNLSLDIRALRPIVTVDVKGTGFNDSFFGNFYPKKEAKLEKKEEQKVAPLPDTTPAAEGAPTVQNAAPQAAEAVKEWSSTPIHMVRFDGFDGSVTFAFDNFTYQGLSIDQFRFGGKLQDGLMIVDTLKGNVLGGKLEAKGNVGVNPMIVSASFALTNVKLEQALRLLTDISDITGYMSVSGSVSMQGNTPAMMVNSLTSSFSMAARGVTVTDFGLHKIVDTTNTKAAFDAVVFSNIVRAAKQSGTTLIHNADAKIAITNGMVRIDGLVFDTDRTKAVLAGNVDLRNQTMNMASRIGFIPVGDTKAVALDVQFKNSINHPTVVVDTRQIETYLKNQILTPTTATTDDGTATGGSAAPQEGDKTGTPPAAVAPAPPPLAPLPAPKRR